MISSAEIRKELDRLKKEVETKTGKAISEILNSPEIKALYSTADIMERASKGKGVPIFSEYIDLGSPEYRVQEQFGRSMTKQIEKMGYVARSSRSRNPTVFYNPGKNVVIVSEIDFRDGGWLTGFFFASDHSMISEEVKLLKNWYKQFIEEYKTGKLTK